MNATVSLIAAAAAAILAVAAPPHATTTAPPRKLIDRVTELENAVQRIQDRLDALERVPPPPKPPRATQPRTGEPKAEKPGSTRDEWRRCTATASSTGKRCRARALNGRDRCTWHDDGENDDQPR